MNKEYFLVLTYFDELKPKPFDNRNLTPEMSAYSIGYGETYDYDFSEIIHQLSAKGFLKQVHRKINFRVLQPFTANTFRGYVLTRKGVNALKEKVTTRV